MALTITCPICGKRNGYEFKYGGEEKGPRPEEKDLTPEAWCEYVHMNKCVAGVQEEWWFHTAGCGSWFKIQRDTTTNLEQPAKAEQSAKADKSVKFDQVQKVKNQEAKNDDQV